MLFAGFLLKEVEIKFMALAEMSPLFLPMSLERKNRLTAVAHIMMKNYLMKVYEVWR